MAVLVSLSTWDEWWYWLFETSCGRGIGSSELVVGHEHVDVRKLPTRYVPKPDSEPSVIRTVSNR